MTILRGTDRYELITWAGDSGTVHISGLADAGEGEDSTLYFQVNGKEQIIKTVQLTAETDEADIDFSVSDTTRIGVGKWPYGVKKCYSNGDEDTLIPNDGSTATFRVNNKVVEGTEDE